MRRSDALIAPKFQKTCAPNPLLPERSAPSPQIFPFLRAYLLQDQTVTSPYLQSRKYLSDLKEGMRVRSAKWMRSDNREHMRICDHVIAHYMSSQAFKELFNIVLRCAPKVLRPPRVISCIQRSSDW
jgi:hypothetical protein